MINCFIGSIGTAEGSALVKLGNTTVMCGIKAVSYCISIKLVHQI